MLSPQICWGVKLKEQTNVNNLDAKASLAPSSQVYACELTPYTTQLETQPVGCVQRNKNKKIHKVFGECTALTAD